MSRPIRVQSVKPTNGYQVLLGLTDGSAREVDLEKYLRGPIFNLIKSDNAEFCKITVDQCSGTVCWPNGADIDPDVLLLDRVPAWEIDVEALPSP